MQDARDLGKGPLYLSSAPESFLYHFFTAWLYITILEIGTGYPWRLHTVPQRLASCSSRLTKAFEGPLPKIPAGWVREVDLQRVKLKLRENGQQKTSNLSCNNAANELNNDVALFTTHNKPVLQQIRLLTGLNWVIKRTTSLFNLFCSNVAKQVTRFCCPFYRSLSTRCSYYLATIYSFKLDTQFTSGTDKFSLQNPFNPFKLLRNYKFQLIALLRSHSINNQQMVALAPVKQPKLL